MSVSLLSSHWHRVSALAPRLRAHVRLHRHEYRGEVWYVLEDRIGGRHHRFNPAAYRLLNLWDGRRSLQQAWDALSAEVDEHTPTQDDIIQLLGRMHAADLVQCDIPPDVAELFERRGRQRRQRWFGRLGNPVALRVPLMDPDPWLQPLARATQRLKPGVWRAVWWLLVGPALVLAAQHWSELTHNFAEQWRGAQSWWAMLLLFPLVKAAHELGHGLACARRGGEVHEAGVMLLVFYPVPYVDVSNAAALGSKWQRAKVGAAGMLAELPLAALAFYLWLALEPGLARSLAWQVAMLASVTTLFFNANPLLRYDGYYILSDLIEVPNLAQRANLQWQHWAERLAFGVRGATPPPATPGERRWFLFYAPVSYVYRLFVSLAIAYLVAGQFFVVGVLLAAWTLGLSVAWPVFKGLRALATGPQYTGRGARVAGVLGGALALLGAALFALPLPHHTHAQGVLWLPEQAVLRAGTGGFVSELLAREGQAVQPGTPVLQAVEPGLMARLAVQQARLEEVGAQHDAAWGNQPARAAQLEEELKRESAALARLQDEAALLGLHAQVAGTLRIDQPLDLPGRYLKKGEVVGFIHTGEPLRVRLVVGQGDVEAVLRGTREVRVRRADDFSQEWPAQMLRAVPAARRELPGAALSTTGGGPWEVDPRAQGDLGTLESVFEFELELPPEARSERFGTRVHVRLAHAPEPVGWRAARAVRRAFLQLWHV